MQIGIISEGHADRAVITNIIVGITGLDDSAIRALRPIYAKDETDKAAEAEHRSKSSFTVIKEECESRELIDGFLSFDGNDFVAIHIDTAEADKFGVDRPDKAPGSYGPALRELVIQQITQWLGVEMHDKLLYAIAIEEIEAWLLTIYEKKDTTSSADPKRKFDHALGKLGLDTTSDYDNFYAISKPFRKTKTVTKDKLLSYNSSLEAFYTEVETKVLPKIEE